MAGKSKNKGAIVRLGPDAALVKTGRGGIVKSFIAEVPLSEAHGELMEVPGTGVSITAAGYYRLNRVAGVSILTPATVVVDGVPRGNPYLVHDENGTLKDVYVRKVAVGYAPTGQLVVVDQTVHFQVEAYFKRDLMKKYRASKGAIGRITTKEAARKEIETGKYMFVPIRDNVGLLVDLSHPDVQRVLETHIENALYGDRKAATIAERNALKKHPALAIQRVNAIGEKGHRVAKVPVHGWVAEEITPQRIYAAAEKALAGVEVIEDATEVTEEDLATVREPEEVAAEATVISQEPSAPQSAVAEQEAVSLFDRQPGATPQIQSETAQSKRRKRKKVESRDAAAVEQPPASRTAKCDVEKLLAKLGDEQVATLFDACGIDNLETATPLQLAMLKAKAQEMINQR